MFWMCLPVVFGILMFSCLTPHIWCFKNACFTDISLRYRFAGRSLASLGPFLLPPAAPQKTTVSVDGYGMGNVPPRMFCSAQAGECNALESTGRRQRQNSKRTTASSQSDISDSFSVLFLWSRCIFFACHGSYIEGQLHIGVSTFSSTLGRVIEAPNVKSLPLHVRARCFEMLVLQNPEVNYIDKRRMMCRVTCHKLSQSLRFGHLFATGSCFQAVPGWRGSFLGTW